VVREDSSLEEEDKSVAGRVPAAMSAAAAGASTALIICQELGALESTSTESATGSANCLSLAFLSPPAEEAVVELAAGPLVVLVAVLVGASVDDGVCDGAMVVLVVLLLAVLVFGVELVSGLLDFTEAAGAGAPEVSLELLWPKLAASLLLISDTAPRSAAWEPGERTVTNLTRAKLLAVGVDLITRLRILAPTCCCCCCCCCSCSQLRVSKVATNKATAKTRMALILRDTIGMNTEFLCNFGS